MANNSWRTLAVVVVAGHLLVSLLHGYAHNDLGVRLSVAQTVFVLVVITAAPIVAALLVWTRFVRFGFLLLLGSMAGALLFGVYYHYIEISPDHVSHLPPGDTQSLFRVTALLLAISELCGLIVAAVALKRFERRAVP